jgi:uncharacterized protein involved in cysteine biosynthesis
MKKIGKGFLLNWGQSFWLGFWAPLRAVPFIFKNPTLLTLVLIPLCINIALYTLFFYYGSHYLDDLVLNVSAKIATQLPEWLGRVTTFFFKFLGWLLIMVVASSARSLHAHVQG